MASLQNICERRQRASEQVLGSPLINNQDLVGRNVATGGVALPVRVALPFDGGVLCSYLLGLQSTKLHVIIFLKPRPHIKTQFDTI